jgi:hypothetical protein
MLVERSLQGWFVVVRLNANFGLVNNLKFNDVWSAIVTWLLNHKKIAVDSVLMLCVALSLIFGVITCKQNRKLSEGLEMAQNNIEAY